MEYVGADFQHTLVPSVATQTCFSDPCISLGPLLASLQLHEASASVLPAGGAEQSLYGLK